MTLSEMGKQYICQNFGDTNLCCVKAGLSWYYTAGGIDYPETGATAQVVSRFVLGLIESLTMTDPARGTFTKAELDAANGSPVTLEDAKEITYHDEPTEDQWCFIFCEEHIDQITCEDVYGCYWWNNACHSVAPSCEELNNESDCLHHGCYWYNGACHSTIACENILAQPECEEHGCYWYNSSCHSNLPPCGQLNNQNDCEIYGCYWWNSMCHDIAPSCEELNNESDCSIYGCYWFRGTCHSADQPELCYWIDSKGGPDVMTVIDVYEIADAYLLGVPPSGWAFIPTLMNVYGIVDYFLGFDGDAKTGCDYY